jgi:hypothetical protein
MVFGNGGSEDMRIDSSGRLLHGKTTAGDYVTGTEIQPAGAILSYRAGGVAAIHGRTDDGEIIRLTSNSSIVGKIGAYLGDSYVGTGVAGLRFYDAGPAVSPHNTTTNVGSDGTTDLGTSAGRFKDLYLSNAVVQDGVKQTTTATTQVAIETFAHADHDGAKVVITAATSADTYVTELLIATNGTTAVATEYGQVGTGSALATYDVDISGSDVRILATPASTTSTTFRVAMTLT